MTDIISTVSTHDVPQKNYTHSDNSSTKDSTKNFKDALDNENNSHTKEDSTESNTASEDNAPSVSQKKSSDRSEDDSEKVLTADDAVVAVEDIVGMIAAGSVPIHNAKAVTPISTEVTTSQAIPVASQAINSLKPVDASLSQPVLTKPDGLGNIADTKPTNLKTNNASQLSQSSQVDNLDLDPDVDSNASLLNKVLPVSNDSKKIFNNTTSFSDQIKTKTPSSLINNNIPTPDSSADLAVSEVTTIETKATEATRVITERLHVLDKKWPESMAAKIALNSANGMQNLKVNINPAKMGPIEIQIAQTDAGINFNLIVSSPSTKDLLDSYSAKIQSSLSDSGLDLGGFDINQQSEREGQESDQGGSMANQYDEPIDSDELGALMPSVQSSLLDSYA